jgi:hypothetical protein
MPEMKSDIGEQTDLAPQMPDKREALSAKLDEYLARINALLPTLNPNYDPTKRAGQRRRRLPSRAPAGSRSGR